MFWLRLFLILSEQYINIVKESIIGSCVYEFHLRANVHNINLHTTTTSFSLLQDDVVWINYNP